MAEYCLVKKWLLGALPLVATHVSGGYQGRTTGLSLCYGSIVGVTVYHSSLETTWFHYIPVQSHRACHRSLQRRRWVNDSTRKGCRNIRCPSARCFAMVRADSGALSVAFVCTAANEAVASERVSRMK
ncbi:hypothetical protein TNCV_4046161 [Trichonephila clavipes]|nr:hypothetical protein TNCV_4046161 [Trichonephila clavipes]